MAFENSKDEADVRSKGTNEADQVACSVFADLPEYLPPRCRTGSNASDDLGTGKVVNPSQLPDSIWDDLPELKPRKAGKSSDDLGTGQVVDPSQLPDSIWDDLPELKPPRPVSGVKKDVLVAQQPEPKPHELRYVDRSRENQ